MEQTVAFTSVAFLTLGLGRLAWIDFKTGYLPDKLQVILALGACVALGLGSPIGIDWREAFLGGGINTGVYYGLRWIVSRVKGREAMGLGDVKLAAVGGLWLGPWALPYVMALSGCLTLVAVGLASVIKRQALWRGEMPLGPGLAAGILATYVAALAGVPGIVAPDVLKLQF